MGCNIQDEGEAFARQGIGEGTLDAYGVESAIRWLVGKM